MGKEQTRMKLKLYWQWYVNAHVLNSSDSCEHAFLPSSHLHGLVTMCSGIQTKTAIYYLIVRRGGHGATHHKNFNNMETMTHEC